MDIRFMLRPVLAVVAISSAALVPTERSAAQTNPGYLWLQVFSANAVGSSGQVALSGQFVNDCTGGLPAGSVLRISFDQGLLLNVTIHAGQGQTQQFSRTVTVPNVPQPKNHVTAYRFVILVPLESEVSSALAPAGPDMKTSPCLVSPALGTPSG